MNIEQYQRYLEERHHTLLLNIEQLTQPRSLHQYAKKGDRAQLIVDRLCRSIKHVERELIHLHQQQLHCQRCGVELAKDRQEVLPYTRYCANCAN